MKFYNNSLSILFESNMLELAPPEANKDDVFGKYLNGQDRKSNSEAGYEPNTPKENELVRNISDYFSSNQKGEISRKYPLIANLIKQKKYLKYLKAPKNAPVYRLMFDLDPKVAAKLLRLPLKEILADANQAWYVSGGGVLAPATGQKIQGWSIDLKPKLLTSISGFSRKITNQPRVSILFVSNTNKGNFFLNPNTMDDLRVDAIEGEDETLSYGPVQFVEACYFYFDPKTSPTFNGETIAKACVVALNTHHVKTHNYEADVSNQYEISRQRKEKFDILSKNVPVIMEQIAKTIQIKDRIPNQIRVGFGPIYETIDDTNMEQRIQKLMSIIPKIQSEFKQKNLSNELSIELFYSLPVDPKTQKSGIMNINLRMSVTESVASAWGEYLYKYKSVHDNFSSYENVSLVVQNIYNRCLQELTSK